MPAIPKDLGNWDGVGDDLDRAIKEIEVHFGYGRAASQDDGLPVLTYVVAVLNVPNSRKPDGTGDQRCLERCASPN